MAEVLNPRSLNACKRWLILRLLRFQHLSLRQPNALTVGIGQILRRKVAVRWASANPRSPYSSLRLCIGLST